MPKSFQRRPYLSLSKTEDSIEDSEKIDSLISYLRFNFPYRQGWIYNEETIPHERLRKVIEVLQEEDNKHYTILWLLWSSQKERVNYLKHLEIKVEDYHGLLKESCTLLIQKVTSSRR